MSKTIALSSPSFRHEQEIPVRFTCEGADISPALHWSDVPPEARSLALVVDDPDAPDPAAPRRTWVHWVLYDIPAHASGLPEDASPSRLPEGTRIGLNDWDASAWGGPCPPIGRHRYFFKLYALDTQLGVLAAPTRDELEKAMDGHVLARGVLIGTYQKRR
jgi:Raf kinase inhibitor-like YbhB/YbcL family protein